MPEPKRDSKLTGLPLLPLRDMLVFPGAAVPLFVGREKTIRAIEEAMMGNKEVILAAQINAKINDPSAEDIYDIGTVSTILQFLKLPDGTVKVLIEGQRRGKIRKYLNTEDYFLVEVEDIHEKKCIGVEGEALIRTVRMAFDNYVRLNRKIPPELLISIQQINDESRLADTIVSHLYNLSLGSRQKLLAEVDPLKRLEEIHCHIHNEIEIIQVEKKIRTRVKQQMEKTQKEYYLNEQMAAIQRELGERDDHRSELNEVEAQIKNKKLSQEARDKLKKEVSKLKSMPNMSAEATVVRNYIDTVLSLPWHKFSEETRDIAYSEKILNKDHFGLEKVKDRILEFLSVRVLSQDLKSPIICFVGPPGVGKTSLARSIAKATGKKFCRISLGGVRDEAEIRGHRRTYIGSMPGKPILALKKVGTSNPVMLLDEIDKMSQDMRGDPSSALLEVLDPEQNSAFVDHYLDLDYDLSKCLFIATANSLHSVSSPLLDRMEIIHIAGYTEEEKVQISKQYLIPKQLKENGIQGQHELRFQTQSIRELINYYTKEAGVRSLEREIGTICRKVARKYLAKSDNSSQQRAAGNDDVVSIKHDDFTISESITPHAVRKYLSARRYRIGMQSNDNEVGICTGMAWTEVGGDLLTCETAVLPGNGKLIITGKLGEVMQESAQAALSYVRSRAKFLELADDFYQKMDIHIHVPEGAIPKDGPSAGICIATALTSALTMRPVSKDIAMTGEITLQGRVIPIGGIKEKILAAHRGGIKRVLLPKDNMHHLENIPKPTLKTLKIIPITHMDDVLIHALVWQKTNGDDLFQKLKQAVNSDVDSDNLSFTH
ncbi:MAG: endopeptidase La [Pseudomonadota bacterium]|nr:endopeptidase La [Pseudomonadota bacterium]